MNQSQLIIKLKKGINKMGFVFGLLEVLFFLLFILFYFDESINNILFFGILYLGACIERKNYENKRGS